LLFSVNATIIKIQIYLIKAKSWLSCDNYDYSQKLVPLETRYQDVFFVFAKNPELSGQFQWESGSFWLPHVAVDKIYINFLKFKVDAKNKLVLRNFVDIHRIWGVINYMSSKDWLLSIPFLCRNIFLHMLKRQAW